MSDLLIDVGNSRVKWGTWVDGGLHDTGAAATQAVRSGEIRLPTSAFRRVLVSNVAGEAIARRLAASFSDDTELRFIETSAALCGVTNAYPDPSRMGVDRWVAVLGARAEFDSACLIVDAGTAATIDALSGDGRHLGGQILPGAPLMMTSLADGTSDLPDIAAEPGDAPVSEALFATDTETAIRHGAWSAVVGAVEHAYRQLEAAEPGARLVLTGGDAPRMLKAIAAPVDHRPDLVLQGLAFILESGA